MSLRPVRSVALATVTAGCAVLGVLAFRGDEEHPLHECLTIADDRSAVFAPDGTRIDDVCDYCLGCHDEIIGPGGPGVRTVRPSKRPEPFQHPDWVQHPRLPANHPLHIAYPAGKPGFHKKGPKASEIVLVRGEVTCISCHDCRQLDRRLVVEPRSAEFCLDCHAK